MGKKKVSNVPKHLRNTSGPKSTSSNSSSTNSGGSSSNSASQPRQSPIKRNSDVKNFGAHILEDVRDALKISYPSSTLLEAAEIFYLKMVYIRPEAGMKTKCNNLKTLNDRLYDTFKEFIVSSIHLSSNQNNDPQEFIELIQKNVDMFQEIQDIISAISNQIAKYETKAVFYNLGGLEIICDICRFFNSAAPLFVEKKLSSQCCKIIENTLSALTYIQFKLIEHTRGRALLKEFGMFGTLWELAQHYSLHIDTLSKSKSTEWHKLDSIVNESVGSILYHIGEILNSLTDEYSSEESFEKLLQSCNPKWFPTSGVIERYGLLTCDTHFAILDLPDMTDWSPEQFNLYLESGMMKLCEQDFDIHTHYSIIRARTGSKLFNSSNFVRWNPKTGCVDLTNGYDQPGYYILRQDHHPNNLLAFVKFIQYLYCSKITKYQTDQEYLSSNTKSDNQSEIRTNIESDINAYSQFISNDDSKRQFLAITSHYKTSKTNSDVKQPAYNCIFDDTDIMLFAIHYSIENAKQELSGRLYIVDQFKQRYYKLLIASKSVSQLDKDLISYFGRGTLLCESKTNFYLDIKLKADGNEVDDALESKTIRRQTLNKIRTQNGIGCHKFMLACRSEYLRKVLEYETLSLDTTSGLDEFCIRDVSLSTLNCIIQFMYCGTSIFNSNPIPTECIIECFVVSDLYMLFSLRKYVEELICNELEGWKKKFEKVSREVVKTSTEMSLVAELHEIATVHIAVNMKAVCFDLLKEYLPQSSQ